MKQEIRQTLRELVMIPAPLNGEEKRAQYCRRWMEERGIGDVTIDECHNVIAVYGLQPGKNNIILMAHLDTVFSADTPLEVREEGTSWLCPGIGDDTANAVAMMAMMQEVWENQPKTACGVIFALDVGEEGLGNLRGARKLMETFGDRVRAAVSFDLYQHSVYPSCIGSTRYELSVQTKGGHSYHNFGNPNAIAVLSQILAELYRYEPQTEETGGMTYNVGVIRGGTSVNTIAQEASALFEYRASRAGDMRAGEAYLQKILEAHRGEGVSVTCRVIGERPCMGEVDQEQIGHLTEVCRDSVKKITGMIPAIEAASTDCNIPLSMGIPAVCVGLIRGGGAHTKEEWIEIASLEEGREIAGEIFRKLTQQA